MPDSSKVNRLDGQANSINNTKSTHRWLAMDAQPSCARTRKCREFFFFFSSGNRNRSRRYFEISGKHRDSGEFREFGTRFGSSTEFGVTRRFSPCRARSVSKITELSETVKTRANDFSQTRAIILFELQDISVFSLPNGVNRCSRFTIENERRALYGNRIVSALLKSYGRKLLTINFSIYSLIYWLYCYQ